MRINQMGMAAAAMLAGLAALGGVGPVSSASEVRTLTLPPDSGAVERLSNAATEPQPARRRARLQAARRARLSMIPWDGKNRASGERAHRRWRRARASGIAGRARG